MGDNGDNTKPVAGKNDMGGNVANLVAGGEADTKGTTGGPEGIPQKKRIWERKRIGGKAANKMKSAPGPVLKRKAQAKVLTIKKQLLAAN